MLDYSNYTDTDIDEDIFWQILSSLSTKSVELIIVDDKEMQNINKEQRGKDKPTDVLSFPIESDFDHLPLGTVIISADTAKRQSQELGHTLEEELKILFIHGILHLQGYDHEVDEGEMEETEENYRKMFQLPNGLIKRNN